MKLTEVEILENKVLKNAMREYYSKGNLCVLTYEVKSEDKRKNSLHSILLPTRLARLLKDRVIEDNNLYPTGASNEDGSKEYLSKNKEDNNKREYSFSIDNLNQSKLYDYILKDKGALEVELLSEIGYTCSKFHRLLFSKKLQDLLNSEEYGYVLYFFKIAKKEYDKQVYYLIKELEELELE